MKVLSYNGEDIKDYARKERDKEIKDLWGYKNKEYVQGGSCYLSLDTVGY